MPSTDPNRGAEPVPGEFTIPDGPMPGFDGLYGLELSVASADEVRGQVVVGDQHKQPLGLVHGGVLDAMAEAMASIGAWVAAGPDKAVSGISNHSNFMRPITDGTIHAVARPRHSGRTTAVWDVEMTGDDGKLAATARVTLAIRDRPPAAT